MNVGLRVIISTLILIANIYMQELASFFVWLIFMYVGNIISKNIFKEIPNKIQFIDFYIIISFLGTLICVDNYNNFENLFGFAADDQIFFNTITSILEGDFPNEISFFSYFIAIIIFPISLIKDLSLLDILPINWVISALICVLLDKFSILIQNKSIPLIVLLFSFCFRFVLFDTCIRLYRDDLILLFILISAILIYSRKYVKSIFVLPFILFLRGANLIIPLLMYIFTRITRRGRIIAICVTLVSFVVLSFYFSDILSFSIKFGSDISRTSRYVDAFSGLDDEEILNLRFSKNAETGNKFGQRAYSSTSVISIIFRAFFDYAFPLSINSPNHFMTHYSLGSVNGFYFYYILMWFCIASFIITTPFLIFGIIKNKNGNLLSLFLVNIIFWVFVLTISGQNRHTASFYMFNVIFITNGFYIYKSNKKVRFWINLGVVFLLLMVVLYNIF